MVGEGVVRRVQPRAVTEHSRVDGAAHCLMHRVEFLEYLYNPCVASTRELRNDVLGALHERLILEVC